MNKLNILFLSAIAAMSITSSTNIQAMNGTVDSVLSIESALVNIVFNDLKAERNQAISENQNISAEYITNFNRATTSNIKAIFDEAIQAIRESIRLFPPLETVKAQLAKTYDKKEQTDAAQQNALKVKTLIKSIQEDTNLDDTKALIYQLSSLLKLRNVDRNYLDRCLNVMQEYEDYTLNVLALIEIY